MLYKIKKVKKLNANERLEVKEGAKNEQYKPYINVNIKMYIFDHLRMYIFAILPLDRYIFSIDRIFP